MNLKFGFAILAGGSGSRLHLSVPKVLAPIGGKLLIDFPICAARDFINPEKLAMIIIGDRDKINIDALREQFGEVEFMDYGIPGI